MLKDLWDRWKVLARKIGDFQARVFLSIFYYLILGPFAIGVRLFAAPSRLRLTTASGWLPRPRVDDDPRLGARRQS